MKELFSPCILGGMQLRSRICRSATNDYAGNEDGTVSTAQMEIYRALAKNEIGLIITGHACVCADGRNDPRQNGMYDDRFLLSQRALTDMVHALGGTIVQQINHSGGKCPPAVIGGAPAAPSAMEYVPGVMARALDAEEIQRIEDDFAAAAVRAKAAGYDGVQIHCAHGYLFSQFIDPKWNQRNDCYGGTAENRFRIVRETIEKVRAAVGKDYPVLLKLHVNTVQPDPDFHTALLSMLDFAAEHGVTAAELSGFDFAAQPPEKRSYYLETARELAGQTALPLILVGGLRDRADMQAALDAGMELVSAARPFICQPDFMRIVRAGGTSSCRGCYGCFRCYQTTGKRCVLHR
ncbi:MAG: NADH:flavin oxidoreductase [Butyricicoccus sp.]